MNEQLFRIESRNKEFMNTVDAQALKQRNEQFAVDLRRQKRSENQFKRRAIMSSDMVSQFQSLELPLDLISLNPALAHPNLSLYQKLVHLYQILTNVQNQDIIFTALHYCRKLLSISKGSSFIKQFSDANFIPVFVYFTSPSMQDRISNEASWCLCNIASGNSIYTQAVVEAKGIEAFISLLQEEKQELAEHAIWGLGNIAGETVDEMSPYRSKLIQLNIIEKLTKLVLTTKLTKKLKGIIAWTLGNLTRSKPPLGMKEVLEVIPTVTKLLRSKNQEVIIDSLWTISHITSNGNNSRIQAIINNNILKLVVPRLKEPMSRMQHPALRVIGNILLGDYLQTQTVLNMGILDDLTGFLQSTDIKVRKEAYWALSNITAGSRNQVKDVISKPIITVAMKGLNDPCFPIRLEASWVFSNIIYTGAREDKLAIFNLGIFTHLREAYGNSDPKYLKNIIEFTEGIFKAGKESDEALEILDKVKNEFVESGCFDAFEKLQTHMGENINSKVLSVLKDYFEFENEELMMEVIDYSVPASGFVFS